MAVSAYVTIDGREGPSTAHKGSIDVLSFSFGASQTATYGTGASGMEARAGRADVSNLTIMKVTDKLSPNLFDDCVTGNILKTVTIFYDKMLGDDSQDFYKIEMTDAMITSVQTSGSSEVPVESVSFAFQKVKVCYNPEADDGSLAGWVEKGFDMNILKPF
jgi:type VI secretion system secreted protein Hcp